MRRPRPVIAATKSGSKAGEVPSTEPAGPQPPAEKPQAAPLGLFELESSATSEELQDAVNRQVMAEVEKSGLLKSHTVLILFDDHSLNRFAADRIYSALAAANSEKPILLILNSSGGDVATAYQIAKLCREHTKANFEVAVPRRAKSAATLVCCGADQIHMGSLSELGPIDPQFGAIPALALKHSVEHIAELAGAYPAASGMFSDYLAKSLRIEALGYFERVAESAAQYASRLLAARKAPGEPRDIDSTSRRLVYSYKDHGFVIDSQEATEIFGTHIVATNSDAYRLANTVFRALDLASWVLATKFSREFHYIGDSSQGCFVWAKTAS